MLARGGSPALTWVEILVPISGSYRYEWPQTSRPPGAGAWMSTMSCSPAAGRSCRVERAASRMPAADGSAAQASSRARSLSPPRAFSECRTNCLLSTASWLVDQREVSTEWSTLGTSFHSRPRNSCPGDLTSRGDGSVRQRYSRVAASGLGARETIERGGEYRPGDCGRTDRRLGDWRFDLGP